jgi:serine/threonine protein phosphatase PrpC
VCCAQINVAIEKTFAAVEGVITEQQVDMSKSGAALSTVLIIGTRIIVASVGDCRVVAAECDSASGVVSARALSVDHNTANPTEAARCASHCSASSQPVHGHCVAGGGGMQSLSHAIYDSVPFVSSSIVKNAS